MTPLDLLVKCAKLFPWAIRDEATADAWLETYTATLGHLGPQELADAWSAYIAQTDKREPPLPAAILMHVHSKIGSAPGSKTMRGASDYCREAVPRLMGQWWADNDTWFQQQLERRPAIDPVEAKGSFVWWLRKDADLHAQRIFWGYEPENAPLQASPQTIRNALGREGPRVASPPSGTVGRSREARRLSEASQRIVARVMQPGDGPGPESIELATLND
jgi:hypothetical protein